MYLPCRLRGHKWRDIVNDRGQHCSYCPSCGAEAHPASPDGCARLIRPQGMGWVRRSVCVALSQRLARPSDFILEQIVSHVELGRWLSRRGLQAGEGLDGRESVQDVAIDLARSGQLLYLEFGMHMGRSLGYWAEHVRRPTAQFVGFDSFCGLPETWRPGVPRGSFNSWGQIPEFEDVRVHVVPGWFEETLPDYELPTHDTLVLNIDSDLYSSARTVLQHMEPHVRTGTLIYFDEFNDHANELRAFEEFLDRTGTEVEVLARSRSWSHWLFRVVQPPRPTVPRPLLARKGASGPAAAPQGAPLGGVD